FCHWSLPFQFVRFCGLGTRGRKPDRGRFVSRDVTGPTSVRRTNQAGNQVENQTARVWTDRTTEVLGTAAIAESGEGGPGSRAAVAGAAAARAGAAAELARVVAAAAPRDAGAAVGRIAATARSAEALFESLAARSSRRERSGMAERTVVSVGRTDEF